MTDDPSTQELRLVQAQRADKELCEAEMAESPEDARAHERRSEKAAYLRDRLAEAEAAERD